MMKIQKLLATIPALLVGFAASAQFSISKIAGYTTGDFDKAACEVVAYDFANKQLFVTNADKNQILVLDMSKPLSGALPLKKTIDLTTYNGFVNSIAYLDGTLAVALEDDVKQNPGKVVFFDQNGTYLSDVPVGALPDMVTFSPDGSKVLTANEGEPNADYSVDPEGSISVIDISGGVVNLTAANVKTADFKAYNMGNIPATVRIFGFNNPTVAQDMEPEYIAFNADGSKAYVTCQENNALAIVDVATATVSQIVPLGFKDWSLPGSGLDASDRSSGIKILPRPVMGIYMPDAIASYTAGGKSYFITANEGDLREYDTYVEEVRVKDVTLDPVKFPNAAELQNDSAIGRLIITSSMGDTDNDGDYDVLYAIGGRGISIWDENGAQVWDSKAQFETISAATYPTFFNVSSTNNTLKNRSDDKGPEPEGLAIGMLYDSAYAFVINERQSNIMVYNVTDPTNPRFVTTFNSRDYTKGTSTPEAGDIAPEIIKFIPASESPTGYPLLAVSYEVSGSVAIFEIKTINPALPVRYPFAKIGTINKTDAVGAADSLNKRFAVSGVVYGPDVRPNGLQFTLRDETGGIAIFSNSRKFGYTFRQGDSITVTGVVSQFNGLTQLSMTAGTDTIIRHPGIYPLKTPTITNVMNEANESDLITIQYLTIVNPADWPAANQTRNARFHNSKGDTFDLRIVNTTDIDGSPVLNGYYHITGVVGQFDNTAPRLQGYQLFPRSLADFVPVTPILSIDMPTSVLNFYEDSASKAIIPFRIEYPSATASSFSFNVTGGTATNGGTDFNVASPLAVSFPVGQSTASVNLNLVRDILAEPTETITFTLTNLVNLELDPKVAGTLTANIINFDTTIVGINKINTPTNIVAYPNPVSANGTLVLALPESVNASTLTFINAQGQSIVKPFNRNTNGTIAISMGGMAAGLYYANIQSEKAIYHARVIVTK